jgi:hypothetical protein
VSVSRQITPRSHLVIPGGDLIVNVLHSTPQWMVGATNIHGRSHVDAWVFLGIPNFYAKKIPIHQLYIYVYVIVGFILYFSSQNATPI